MKDYFICFNVEKETEGVYKVVSVRVLEPSTLTAKDIPYSEDLLDKIEVEEYFEEDIKTVLDDGGIVYLGEKSPIDRFYRHIYFKGLGLKDIEHNFNAVISENPSVKIGFTVGTCESGGFDIEIITNGIQKDTKYDIVGVCGEELVKEITDCYINQADELVLNSEFKPYNKCNVKERMDGFILVDTGTDISMEYTVLYMNTHYSVLDSICTVNQSEKCITVGGKVLIIEGVDGDTCTVNDGVETVILTTNGFDCVDGVKHIVIPDSVENILCSISTNLQKLKTVEVPSFDRKYIRSFVLLLINQKDCDYYWDNKAKLERLSVQRLLSKLYALGVGVKERETH